MAESSSADTMTDFAAPERRNFRRSRETRLVIRLVVFLSLRVAIVISGDGEDLRRIILIGLVELGRIVPGEPIEIDYIAEMKEEAGIALFRLHRSGRIGIKSRSDAELRRTGELRLHLVGNQFNDFISFYGSRIADSMKYKFLCLIDLVGYAGNNSL